jgi:hypothetical protein
MSPSWSTHDARYDGIAGPAGTLRPLCAGKGCQWRLVKVWSGRRGRRCGVRVQLDSCGDRRDQWSIGFVLTLRIGLLGSSKKAVTLLPQRRGRQWPVWTGASCCRTGTRRSTPTSCGFPWRNSGSTANIPAIVGLSLYCLGMTLVLTARRTLGIAGDQHECTG